MHAQICTAEDIKQLGTILAVWAHPDDESFTSAGLLASAVQNGQTVVCVSATKGEIGNYDKQRWPEGSLGELREKELLAAYKILGITQYEFLGYHDGDCKEVQLSEGAAKVEACINKYHPDTIITFGPDGLTGHADHIAVSQWAETAVRNGGHDIVIYQATTTRRQYEQSLKFADKKFNMYFNIKEPALFKDTDCAICFKLSPQLCDLKHRALAAMPTQTEELLKFFDDDSFATGFGEEAFVRAKPNKA